MDDSQNVRNAAKEQAQREARMRFRSLLLANPNYFGNLVDSNFDPVLPIQKSTLYEEIGCVGYQPQLEQLEAVVYIKQPSGYSGSICDAGSREFVRFYLSFDNGATWEDQGITSFRVWDIPEGTEGGKRLEYAASMKVDPKRKLCTVEHLIQMRAILSWNNPPPPNQPNWTPVWGEVQDADIQVEPFKFIVTDDLLSLAMAGVQPSIAKAVKTPATSPLANLIDPDVKIPVKSQPMVAVDLMKVYANKGVPVHRFAHTELMQFIDKPVAVQPDALQTMLPGIKIDPDISDFLFPKSDGDTSYEELTCIGLDPNLPNTLIGIVHVKKPAGYSGSPCSDGSQEHVTFWADFDDNGSFETCLGTASVTVYDLDTIPAQGLHYAVRLPVDLSKYRKSCKNGPVLVRIRAILSWNIPAPCANPNYVPTWGNREQTTIHIAPKEVAHDQPGYIACLGGIPTDHIHDVTGLTTADAVFCTNNMPPDPDPDTSMPGNQGARPCPFAGRVTVQGAPLDERSYVVEVSEDNSVWTPVLKDLVVTNEMGFTSTHKADPVTKRFDYLPFGQNINGLLAQWDTSGNDRWYVRLSVYNGNALVSTDTHRIQLHNSAPTVSIDITSGTGNCGKFTQGDSMQGNFVARDKYLRSYSIRVLPGDVNGAGVGVPSPSLGITQTPIGGDNWQLEQLDTTGMVPCGYVIHITASNLSIVNSQSKGIYRSDSAGFCLEG